MNKLTLSLCSSLLMAGVLAAPAVSAATCNSNSCTGLIDRLYLDASRLYIEMKGKKRVIKVMGVFELNDDGKSAKWRDYFDSAEFQREFGDLAGG